MMNINTGQKGEETWDRAWGYSTPQHISPRADVRRNSRTEAEGTTAHHRPAGSEQAPVCFQRQKQSWTTQGLKGEDISDIKVIWELTSVYVPCSHLAFIVASHCIDTADIYTHTGFTQTDGKGSQIALRNHAFRHSEEKTKRLTKEVLTPEEAARPCK